MKKIFFVFHQDMISTPLFSSIAVYLLVTIGFILTSASNAQHRASERALDRLTANKVAVFDETGRIYEPLTEFLVPKDGERKFELELRDQPVPSEKALAELLSDPRENLSFAIVFEAGLLDPDDPSADVSFWGLGTAPPKLLEAVRWALRMARLKKADLDLSQLDTDWETLLWILVEPYDIDEVVHTPRNPVGSELTPISQARFAAVPAVLIQIAVVFFLSIIGSGELTNFIAVRDNKRRITDLLLGTATKGQLMSGRILSNVLRTTVIGASLCFISSFCLRFFHHDTAEAISEVTTWQFYAWFFVSLVLLSAAYGAVRLAQGTSRTHNKTRMTFRAFGALGSILLMFWASDLAWLFPVSDTLTTILVANPITAPFATVFTVAADPKIPFWKPLLGAVVTAAVTITTLAVSYRVYRRRLLRTF